MKSKFKTIILFLFFLQTVFSQFAVAEIEIDSRQLKRDSDRYLLEELKNQITNYLTATVFAPDAMDLELLIELHFVVEDIVVEGAERIVKAQAVITNGLDQQLFAKGVDFPYSPGQALNYSPIYEPLAGFLDYYALMIIAGELDTYDLLGGSNYYSKALEVAENGRSSMYGRGWDIRWKKCKELTEITELREAKLQFYLALEVMMTPKAKKKELLVPLEHLIHKIREIEDYYGADRNTIIFLKPHAIEIGSMLAALDKPEELAFLMDFDRENKALYEKGYKDYLKR